MTSVLPELRALLSGLVLDGAQRFVREVKDDDAELARYLRIEERELAGASNISAETVAFDVNQRDAVRLKVLLAESGAKVRIESAPRRDADERRPSISEAVRNEVWRKDAGRCVDCGSRENLHFDHIIPWSRGGASTARNLELRCESCNLRKGARI